MTFRELYSMYGTMASDEFAGALRALAEEEAAKALCKENGVTAPLMRLSRKLAKEMGKSRAEMSNVAVKIEKDGKHYQAVTESHMALYTTKDLGMEDDKEGNLTRALTNVLDGLKEVSDEVPVDVALAIQLDKTITGNKGLKKVDRNPMVIQTDKSRFGISPYFLKDALSVVKGKDVKLRLVKNKHGKVQNVWVVSEDESVLVLILPINLPEGK